MKHFIGFTRTAMMAAALTVPALAQQSGAAGSSSGSMSPDMGVDRMSRTSPVEQQDSGDLDLGWMGLLGLAGLAGLRRKQTRSNIHSDAEMHRKMGHDVNRTDRV